MPLIVVVVSKISRRSCSRLSAICLRSQDADMSYMVVPPIACDRTTIRAWSHHQSFVIVSNSRTISSSTSHKLSRLVARPNGDASHDLHLQSLATIGGTCKRAITTVITVGYYDIIISQITSGPPYVGELEQFRGQYIHSNQPGQPVS